MGITSSKEVPHQNLPVQTDEVVQTPDQSLVRNNYWEDKYLLHADLSALPRSQDVFRKIESDPSLALSLPKPGATAGSVLAHAIRTFDSLAKKNTPMTFKFGITHDAHIRWHNKTFGYRYSKDVFDFMLVIYAASNPYGPAFLEAALIEHFGSSLFQLSSTISM